MTDAISKTTSNETLINVLGITHLPLASYDNLSTDEASAAWEMNIAKKLYRKITEDAEHRNEALNNWYWSWRKQINIAQSTESALLALETALDLTIWLNSSLKEDLIFESAIDFMKKFMKEQLEAHKSGKPGLIEMIYPVDSTKKAAILFRVYPPGSKDSQEVQIIWARLCKA